MANRSKKSACKRPKKIIYLNLDQTSNRTNTHTSHLMWNLRCKYLRVNKEKRWGGVQYNYKIILTWRRGVGVGGVIWSLLKIGSKANPIVSSYVQMCVLMKGEGVKPKFLLKLDKSIHKLQEARHFKLNINHVYL